MPPLVCKPIGSLKARLIMAYSTEWDWLARITSSIFSYVLRMIVSSETANILQSFTNFSMTASYGFNFFFPEIVSGLGIGSGPNTTEEMQRIYSLLLTAPPYIFAALVSFAFAYNSDRIKDRSFHIIPALCLSLTGFVITVATLNYPARYFSSFLFTPGSFSANPLVYTWAVSTLSTTPEKRAASGAIVSSFPHISRKLVT